MKSLQAQAPRLRTDDGVPDAGRDLRALLDAAEAVPPAEGVSAQLATLGVGSLRHSRRRVLGLAEQAQQAQQASGLRARRSGSRIEKLLGTLSLLRPREPVQVLNLRHVTGGAVRDDGTVLIIGYGNRRAVPASRVLFEVERLAAGEDAAVRLQLDRLLSLDAGKDHEE